MSSKTNHVARPRKGWKTAEICTDGPSSCSSRSFKENPDPKPYTIDPKTPQIANPALQARCTLGPDGAFLNPKTLKPLKP